MKKRIVISVSLIVLVFFLSILVVSAEADYQREKRGFLNAVLEFFSFQWLYQLTSSDYGKVIPSDIEGVELEFKGDLSENEKMIAYENLKKHISKLTPLTKDVVSKIIIVPKDGDENVRGEKTFDLFDNEGTVLGSPLRIGLIIESDIEERNFRRGLAYWLGASFHGCGGRRYAGRRYVFGSEIYKAMENRNLYLGKIGVINEGEVLYKSLYNEVNGEFVYADMPDYKGPRLGVMNPASLYGDVSNTPYFVDAVVGEPEIFKDLLVETNEWYEIYRTQLNEHYKYGFISYEEYKKAYEYAGLTPPLTSKDKVDIPLLYKECRGFEEMTGDCSNNKCIKK